MTLPSCHHHSNQWSSYLLLLLRRKRKRRSLHNLPCRFLSTTLARREILLASTLPDRLTPHYVETPSSSLLSLHWPCRPPRNILLVPKLHAPHVTLSLIAFARHLRAEYPDLNIVLESAVARNVHQSLPFPVYAPNHDEPSCSSSSSSSSSPYSSYTAADEKQQQPLASSHDATTADLLPRKIDLVTTLGGDGTVLRAASIFATSASVPPILSFSMGSLGFLGEWSFDEYKRAWREVYMSGCGVELKDLAGPHTLIAAGLRTEADLEARKDGTDNNGWDQTRGKCLGLPRASKILLRHRLKVGLYDSDGTNINRVMLPTSTADPNPPWSPTASTTTSSTSFSSSSPPSLHAINELLIHRGPHPHLAVIDIFLNGRFLTEAVADGILISTPTGSTAYSLSAGGSIVHPLVKSLLITPICPRSLSFRPLVLPVNTRVGLRVSAKNRGRELELSIDGKRRTGVSVGMEMRVEGEMVGRKDGTSNVPGAKMTKDGGYGDGVWWEGGVPCVIRAPGRGTGGKGTLDDDDEGWVGGLNGLLKFNYPFGEHP